jgi:hypothetical protein
MVNSIKEVNYYLSKGANAIEADVAFAPNGTALYTFHGYPCDCFRHCTEMENLAKYLEYIREITRTGKSLTASDHTMPTAILSLLPHDRMKHWLSCSSSHSCLTLLCTSHVSAESAASAATNEVLTMRWTGDTGVAARALQSLSLSSSHLVTHSDSV